MKHGLVLGYPDPNPNPNSNPSPNLMQHAQIHNPLFTRAFTAFSAFYVVMSCVILSLLQIITGTYVKRVCDTN